MNKLELKLPPVLVALLAAGLMWLVAQCPLGAQILPAGIRLELTALFLMLGAIAGLGGVMAFHRHKTTVDPTKPENASTLVTGGIYRVSRNPMYLGLLLGLTAWGCFLSHLLSLLVLIPFVLYMNRFQIRPEERMMAGLFGEKFELYRRTVRRWL
ncbi:isoprenylcysteine carboxylmethyltransferase family protein [Ferrimonas sediminicola]|uniref:Isoprenylcysteine carboxylmethyltransferase family protein n=1 Tax=Ferrimonas sediminicola TaxID=2569538 RepID=A0A4U1BJ83_9GAMM|nr:isoprenylcysteine carboxylmethyltransferase family protein [Ferrimonas sediminicola]TKB50599.1 isoprenylcysteine carboxylmethyltransferase family protein [Ferrimonas sediminicola]